MNRRLVGTWVVGGSAGALAAVVVTVVTSGHQGPAGASAQVAQGAPATAFIRAPHTRRLDVAAHDHAPSQAESPASTEVPAPAGPFLTPADERIHVESGVEASGPPLDQVEQRARLETIAAWRFDLTEEGVIDDEITRIMNVSCYAAGCIIALAHRDADAYESFNTRQERAGGLIERWQGNKFSSGPEVTEDGVFASWVLLAKGETF